MGLARSSLQRMLPGLIAVSLGVGAALVADASHALVLIVAGTGFAVLLAASYGNPEAASGPSNGPEFAKGPIEGHAEFRAIAEELPDGVLIARGGRIAFANRAARELLGDHLLGEDVRTAIRHPAAAERLTGASGAIGSETIDLVGLGKLGRHLEMRIVPLPDGGHFVALVDVTAIDAAERARTDFVANASHELRTPLASVVGFVETLGDPATAADEQMRSRFLQVMGKEARRMQQLVDDLLSLSRIEASKFRLPDQSVDLTALAGRVICEMKDGRTKRADDIVLEAEARIPPVRGDEAQLSQLLHNLIGNAMTYGHAGTPVTVAMRRAGDGSLVELSVTDRGEGIAAEHIPRLTERFYRVDSARSRSLGGTGIGLSLVKHIVARHRGRLDIASREGEGTTVTVALPAISDAADPVTKA